MKQIYKEFNFRPATLKMIELTNSIIDEYIKQGYVLTVRQLYYQLVARGHIPNTERSYKNTTSMVNDARLAGLMDWSAIEDRTRSFIRRSRWDSPNDLLAACAQQFHMDMWLGQVRRVFVIVEKEALAGVLEGVCNRYDVPLLAARGYPSCTVLRDFAIGDLNQAIKAKQKPVVLHLGDHDPSGIDMSRDLTERFSMFIGGKPLEFDRIALNMDQIEEQSPPPNPAKVTDSRFERYQEMYGDESWELDALQPSYLNGLVESNILKYVDTDLWADRVNEIAAVKERLETVAEEFE